MKNVEKMIKKMIFVVIIVFVIAMMLYLILVDKNEILPYDRKYTPENEDTMIDVEQIKAFEKVKYRYQYNTIELLTERYFTYIIDSLYADNSIKAESQKALYNIIDQTYLSEFNINDKSDLVKKYKDFRKDEQIIVNDIYIMDLETNVNLYLVKGNLIFANKKFLIFIKTDTLNKTFSIFPMEYIEKYKYSEETEKINIDKGAINKNEYNSFKFSSMPDEKIALTYFNELKKYLLGSPEKTYNLLDEEYRVKRFENKENFNKYLEKNKTELSQIKMNSYLIQNQEDYTKYVCEDQYGNIYIFKETAVNEYTIELDDYTLDYKNEEYIKKYNSSTDQYKVANNINKWVKMLNNRDYKAAYNVLDKTFRETFGGQEKFEQYMRKAFPEHYSIEYGKTTENAGIYTQEIILKDITGKSNMQIEKTIIMKLGEGTNFTMSFNVAKGDTAR